MINSCNNVEDQYITECDYAAVVEHSGKENGSNGRRAWTIIAPAMIISSLLIFMCFYIQEANAGLERENTALSVMGRMDVQDYESMKRQNFNWWWFWATGIAIMGGTSGSMIITGVAACFGTGPGCIGFILTGALVGFIAMVSAGHLGGPRPAQRINGTWSPEEQEGKTDYQLAIGYWETLEETSAPEEEHDGTRKRHEGLQWRKLKVTGSDQELKVAITSETIIISTWVENTGNLNNDTEALNKNGKRATDVQYTSSHAIYSEAGMGNSHRGRYAKREWNDWQWAMAEWSNGLSVNDMCGQPAGTCGGFRPGCYVPMDSQNNGIMAVAVYPGGIESNDFASQCYRSAMNHGANLQEEW